MLPLRFLAVLILSLSGSAIAAPPAPDPDSPNAAARYLALFETMDKTLAERAAYVQPNAGQFTIDVFEDQEFTAADVRQTLLDHQDWINRFIAATELDTCDFRLEVEAYGVMPPPPDRIPMTPFRAVNRILLADAYRNWAANDVDAAVGRVAASLRLSRHIVDQHNCMYLWPLVADSHFEKACEAISQLNQSTGTRSLNPAHRALLDHIVQRFDATDPSGIRRAVLLQARSFLDFAETELRDGEVGSRLIIATSLIKGVDVMASNLFTHVLEKAGEGEFNRLPERENRDLFAELTRQSGFMTHGNMTARMARARAMLIEIDEIWPTPDAESRLRSLDQEVEADESGFLAATFVGGIARPWQKWRQTCDRIAELRLTLQSQIPAK